MGGVTLARLALTRRLSGLISRLCFVRAKSGSEKKVGESATLCSLGAPSRCCKPEFRRTFGERSRLNDAGRDPQRDFHETATCSFDARVAATADPANARRVAIGLLTVLVSVPAPTPSHLLILPPSSIPAHGCTSVPFRAQRVHNLETPRQS